MMERKQIFGMDVIEDPTMPPGTFKMINPFEPYENIFVSYAGMTFVKKMTREEFKAAYPSNPAARQPKP